MPNYTITIDTKSVSLFQLADAFAKVYSYQPIIDGQINPESKTLFANRHVKDYIKTVYIQAKTREWEETKNIIDPLFE